VRRDEAADMRRSELEGGVWTIPAVRYKTAFDFEVPLSMAAQNALSNLAKLGKQGFVFTTNGNKPINNFLIGNAPLTNECSRLCARLQRNAMTIVQGHAATMDNS
jgi:integrase